MKRTLLIGLALFLIMVNIANSIAPSSTFPRETKFFDKLAAGDEQFVIIDNPEILFTKVGVTTNTDVNRARVVVQAMPDCPENAPKQTDVLQCFIITTQSFGDKQLAEAEIHFKVPKEWILSNGYDENAIELRRYSYSWNIGGKLSEWRVLDTVLEDEDDDYYHYRSTTDGFSYFSIVGGEEEMVSDGANEEILGNNNINNDMITETPIREEKPDTITLQNPQTEESNSSPIWIFAVVLAVISIGISFVLHKRGNVVEPEDSNEVKELEPLVSYIQSIQDYPKEYIQKTLTDAGWKDWQIEMAFNQIKLKNSEERL